ncbi:MAG: collagen-like protein [Chitinophagaceae bacterium]|nr:collagen-like protein [Oligoflexus sp.]
MGTLRFLKISCILLVFGCSAHSKTTCADPDSTDPVCVLATDHVNPTASSGASAEAGIPQCTAQRDGLIFYVRETGAFKLCAGGKNIDVSVRGPEGPQGAEGPQGNPGTPTPGGEGATVLSTSAVVAPGAALTLTHNFNVTLPNVSAYFLRKGVLRPVSEYKNEVATKVVPVTGDSWAAHFRPQIINLASGNIAVIHEDLAQQSTPSVTIDLYTDEGVPIKLKMKSFPALTAIRALAVSNGIFILYQQTSSTDEYFMVINEDGSTALPPMLNLTTAVNNHIKDLKKLSNGTVVIAEQSAGNAASYTIIDPRTGSVIASNNNVAASSDFRTFTAPLNGRFLLFFNGTGGVDSAKFAIVNNDGSLNAAPAPVGLGNETIMGTAAVGEDRVAVVTSFLNDISSSLFDASMNPIRGKTIYSPFSSDGDSPVPLANGNWIVCSSRSEGYCVTYDHDGTEIYRNSELFASSNSTLFNTIVAVGSEGRFAISTFDDGSGTGAVQFAQSAMGRLDLEVLDANTVRIVNRSVETLSLVLSAARP